MEGQGCCSGRGPGVVCDVWGVGTAPAGALTAGAAEERREDCSDGPALDAAVLRQAAVALRDHTAVFVPALDGGYALVGLHVGYDVATHNRGMLPAQRLSPWLRGVFWLPYAVVGFGLTVGDALRQR